MCAALPNAHAERYRMHSIIAERRALKLNTHSCGQQAHWAARWQGRCWAGVCEPSHLWTTPGATAWSGTSKDTCYDAANTSTPMCEWTRRMETDCMWR